MKAHNKIGFHTGPGGDVAGLGDWMRALDAAAVPFLFKAVDATAGLEEAQQLAREPAEEQARHILIFRSDVDDDFDYSQEPEAAAVAHWQRHKAAWPPELDPALVWVETMQEPRPDVAAADWLGHVAYHTGQIALTEGYKYAAFSYATGAPDEGAWETDGMLRYLALCQEHPDRLAVALHEFSLKTEDIWFMRGDHIGRFQKLFSACARRGLQRPNLLISEWGWTHSHIPEDVDKAVEDIRQASAYYARYPNVLGVALWGLGEDGDGIGQQVQALLQPMTDLSLTQTFDVPAREEQPRSFPRPEAGRSATGPVAARPNARFIADVTVPDDMRLAAGAAFTKTWRVENNGNVAWGPGFKLVHTAGVAMTGVTSQPLPAAQPGQQVNISVEMIAPTSPGVHFSDWRFQDDQRRLFGDIIYARIVAQAVTTPPVGVSDSRFVADVTIPDDTSIAPGATFTKTWRVRNTGTRAWGPPTASGFTLDFIGGLPMTEVTTGPLPAAAPGQEVDISIPMTAPTATGVHYGDWRMKDDQGNFFGHTLYVRITVPPQAGASLTKPLSQRDPLWEGKRLGHPGSPKTIGEWGCMMTCFAMVANTFGYTTTPAELNDLMIQRGGYLDGYLTKWNALSQVYGDIIYDGKVESRADITNRINASLAEGRPVTVQVDFTANTPYTENDQHWVLIVGRDGDDYRINDPYLYPTQESSLRQRYGRTGRPLWEAIMSAIFHRTARKIPQPVPEDEQKPPRLETGMNINPDAPHSNPMDSDDLKGMDWVRFVFKLAARENPAERDDIAAAFAQYDPLIEKYNQMGLKSLIVINQETVWGIGPWTGNNDWPTYANQLAEVARQVAARYRHYGAQMAYEIWNEGDLANNPASVYVPPEQFAIVLKRVADAIRAESPQSPLVFGGLATGPDASVAYLNRCKAALNGPWPVDAIGIHPYGRWATRAPFDWGQHFGTLGDAIAIYTRAFPTMPLWITEIGVAADQEIGPVYYEEIGHYVRDVFQYLAARHARQVPVVIWFGWSDWMRNAGIVNRDGQRKDHVYAAFRVVRNRELPL